MIPDKTCKQCGNPMQKRPKEAYWQFDKRQYCSRRCRGIYENQKVDDSQFKPRYRQVKTPDGRHMLEHRWVVEQHIGRRLRSDEQVHHMNHDRLDNRIENLEVVSTKEHGLRHTFLPATKKCSVCGSEFTPHKTKRRTRKTCGPKCKAIQTKRTREQNQQAVLALERLFGGDRSD